ncbi:hypothetical protein AVEN_235170-1 [Araneus ventricosus]|uniref:Ig-like domain-containing protein n=1 Tax=Araneus ventricosus TaxID=182803 RepID=A0A4Y2JCL1_ARAVE|nr:hypothetical protein AVEN_235170-1 [Araneus ventricosus]
MIPCRLRVQGMLWCYVRTLTAYVSDLEDRGLMCLGQRGIRRKRGSEVVLSVRPISVKMEGGPRPMSAEKPVDIVCKSAGSKPPAVISWWMGSTRLKHNKDTVSADGNFTSSVLTFRPSIDDNGKQLTCRAENPLIAGSALDDTWDLEIHCKEALNEILPTFVKEKHEKEWECREIEF